MPVFSTHLVSTNLQLVIEVIGVPENLPVQSYAPFYIKGGGHLDLDDLNKKYNEFMPSTKSLFTTENLLQYSAPAYGLELDLDDNTTGAQQYKSIFILLDMFKTNIKRDPTYPPSKQYDTKTCERNLTAIKALISYAEKIAPKNLDTKWKNKFDEVKSFCITPPPQCYYSIGSYHYSIPNKKTDTLAKVYETTAENVKENKLHAQFPLLKKLTITDKTCYFVDYTGKEIPNNTLISSLIFIPRLHIRPLAIPSAQRGFYHCVTKFKKKSELMTKIYEDIVEPILTLEEKLPTKMELSQKLNDCLKVHYDEYQCPSKEAKYWNFVLKFLYSKPMLKHMKANKLEKCFHPMPIKKSPKLFDSTNPRTTSSISKEQTIKTNSLV